jgi:ribosomal protein S18 acetylase RimI-like enzyme
MQISIINVDFNNPIHSQALLQMLDEYACDPMGGGTPLSEFCRTHLIEALKIRPTVCAVLALVDTMPAGFSICMEGFSTFACQPLLNIHDFAVSPAFRGHGIGRQLLAHIEGLAAARGCCKMTLEVLQGNQVAQSLYRACGFAPYELDPAMGGALMMQKLV